MKATNPAFTPSHCEPVRFLTYNDVAAALNMSPRNVRRVKRRMGLVPIQLGYRTVRFHPEDVAKAQRRLAGLAR